MTDTLWHGNDDPPRIGQHIEYILGGEVYEGDYCKGGYISRGTEADRLRMIDNMKRCQPVEACMTIELIQGDCMDVMKGMESGSVDAVVTDPPYGIGEDGGLKARYRNGDGRTKGIIKHEYKGWDKQRPQKIVFDLMFVVSNVVIICGGNYFADMLPPSSGWIYWDKNIGGDFSDGELIYTNQDCALRDYSVHPFLGLRGGKDREHPTQNH